MFESVDAGSVCYLWIVCRIFEKWKTWLVLNPLGYLLAEIKHSSTLAIYSELFPWIKVSHYETLSVISSGSNWIGIFSEENLNGACLPMQNVRVSGSYS